MLLSKIIGFFEGKVQLYADSENREKFISLLMSSSVNAKISGAGDDGGVYARMMPSDVKKIAPALDKNGIIVYINNVYGLKKICVNNFKRLGILVGFLIFGAVLALSTLFVFKIEVGGSELISKEQIKDELSDFGIRVGAKLSDIDRTTAANRFLALHPEFSWVAINFRGTTVRLELKEKNESGSDTEEKSDFLVAECDGVIKSLLVYSGKGMVKPGSVVKKGDLLVTGFISGNGLQYTDNPVLRYDGASGSVKAEVSEEVTVFVPFEEYTETVVSRKKVGTVFSVFGFEFSIGSIPEERANVEFSGEKNVTVMGEVELPVTYTEVYVTETQTLKKTRDELSASAEAEKRLYKEIGEKLSQAELTELEVIKEVSDDGVKFTGKYGCIKEIAVPKNRN